MTPSTAQPTSDDLSRRIWIAPRLARIDGRNASNAPDPLGSDGAIASGS